MSVTAAPGNERWREPAAWTLIVLVFAAFGFVAWYRATYNVFPGQGADAQVHWCSRDYDAAGLPAVSLQQARAGATSPVRVVGAYPPLALHREQLLAEEYPGPHTTSCALVAYLRTGPDRYEAYQLSGGP